MKLRQLLLTALLLACALAIAACGNNKPNDLNYKLEPFTYTDQSGKPFALSDLSGKVWVSDFIFTQCTTVCPMLTANMAKLQQQLQEADVQAELVSFSVDPKNDTPEGMKAYFGKFSEDDVNWHGLTGYSFEEIRRFSRTNYKVAVEKDASSDQVIHGTSFYLVDQTGTVVASYDGQDPPYKQIVKDVKSLLK
ncbi:SCO family protein [Cohnella soli]|uniref:SCO family protein n=1 Tax=Cohnella soli TaxID=425005 RepID=A0ABW0I1K5_9BACL